MMFGDFIGTSNLSADMAFGAITTHLATNNKMDNNGEMNNTRLIVRDDEYECRSGSENLDVSGDDLDGGKDDQRQKKKKKYHRHTLQQTQELESFFKEYPHPDEKQRLELSRKLGLEIKQIKFWFQNKRTQMKTQIERHENIMLRQEYEKLCVENVAIKDAMRSPICNDCGGPATMGEISFEEHQLRIENVRLKDELNRLVSLVHKFLGRPFSTLSNTIPSPISNLNLDLAVERDGLVGFNNVGTPSQMGLYFGDGDSVNLPAMQSGKAEILVDRSMLVDLAVASMDELIRMSQANSPFWTRNLDGSKDILNHEEYMKTFSSLIGVKPSEFVTEATRSSGTVIINSRALIETFMDANRWAEMFPTMISGASTIAMISNGLDGTRNGALQVMHAEFQLPSPLVSVRQVKFLRFSKQLAEDMWAVVDVSVDNNLAGSNQHSYMNCRRLPSGCIMQDMPNGYSKVTWVEHSEFDERAVHHLYWPLINSGFGFGAKAWIATLQRQCECLTILLSSSISGEGPSGIDASGKRSMMKLAQRMIDIFCSGICASNLGRWDKLQVGNVSEDVRMMARKSLGGPGEPPGVVLSAATSVWLPVTQQRLFDFLRDERRSEWDNLSNSGPMQELVRIPKGQGHGNCVSIFRASALNSNDNGMLILQETWTDASGSMVVYAPVDMPSVNLMMNGGDSHYVALLPSGFVIHPDGRSDSHSGTSVKGSNDGSGLLLTIGFQILMNSLPTQHLTMESVETVNNLITCTVEKIKAALQIT